MRILYILAPIVLLSACSIGMNPDTTTNSGATQSTGAVATVTSGVAESGSLVTLNYTLHEGTATGTILESTLEDVAKQAGLYVTGSTYQPFQLVLGQGSVIPGFENGLLGMKKGESKVIMVTPEEGYGTGARVSTIAEYKIAPVFTITKDKGDLSDTVVETIPTAEFPATMQASVASATVGSVLTGANDTTAKVIAVNSGSLTLEIQNVNSPFYGKKLAVGTTASTPTESIKITAMNGTGVTLEVTNKESPFYNKKFAVGESVTTKGGKITINAINEVDQTVTVAVEHPLMGKTLYFDVNVLDVQ